MGQGASMDISLLDLGGIQNIERHFKISGARLMVILP